jgi:hypothetical protein
METISKKRQANRFPLKCPRIAIPPFHSPGIAKSHLPSPLGDCVAIVKKSRHSGESRNPVAVLLNNSIFLDARLRGHDEL